MSSFRNMHQQWVSDSDMHQQWVSNSKFQRWPQCGSSYSQDEILWRGSCKAHAQQDNTKWLRSVDNSGNQQTQQTKKQQTTRLLVVSLNNKQNKQKTTNKVLVGWLVENGINNKGEITIPKDNG